MTVAATDASCNMHLDRFIATHADGIRGGRVSLFQRCLPVFQTMSENPTQLESPNLTQMFHDEYWKSIYFGSKDQRSRSQRLCRSSDRTQYCRCCLYVSRAGFFPAVMLRRTSNASDTGFPLRHWTLSFSRRACLHSCEYRLLLVVVCSE